MLSQDLVNLLREASSLSGINLNTEIFYECLLKPDVDQQIFKFMSEDFLKIESAIFKSKEAQSVFSKTKKSKFLTRKFQIVQKLIDLEKVEKIFGDFNNPSASGRGRGMLSLINRLSTSVTDEYKNRFWSVFKVLWMFSSAHWLLHLDALLEKHSGLADTPETVSLFEQEFKKLQRINRY